MKSIILIVPYFGKWPIWFEAYLVSIKKNNTINWLFITDCEIPVNKPINAQFKSITLKDFNDNVNKELNLNIPLSARKICDLRIAFAQIFRREILDYDFWGYCDVDIIWGDIRKFITNEKLQNFEIISSRKENTSGHFTVFKNINKVNSFYCKIPNYNNLLEHPLLQRLDEDVLTRELKRQGGLKISWNITLLNHDKQQRAHQEYYLDKWRWQDGKLIDNITQEEVMYLHFINWKRTMKYSEVCYKDDPQLFYISFNGMHYQLHTSAQKIWRNFVNFFDGYEVKRRRRKQKTKIKSLLKRAKRKLNNI